MIFPFFYGGLIHFDCRDVACRVRFGVPRPTNKQQATETIQSFINP